MAGKRAAKTRWTRAPDTPVPSPLQVGGQQTWSMSGRSGSGSGGATGGGRAGRPRHSRIARIADKRKHALKDRNTDPLTVTVPAGHLTRGQLPHLLLLATLLPGAWSLASPALDGGAWLGAGERLCFLVAGSVPVVRQIAVAIVWRARLGHSVPTSSP